MNLTTWLMTVLGVAAGGLLGALLHAWWLRRNASARLRLPAKWPLGARGLVTTSEHEVWKWLRSTFHDHVVMVKIPVQRFTIPLDRGHGQAHSERWRELLNGVYTTFTVCTTDGKVVGCVDVPGKRGLSQDNFEFKETLLSDCGIPYTVVRGAQLPTGSAMRTAFLGEAPVELVQEVQETFGGDSSFHAELAAFTTQRVKAAKEAALKELNRDAQQATQPAENRNVGFNPEGTGSIRAASGKPDRFAVQWEDSFIQAADTRPARLE